MSKFHFSSAQCYNKCPYQYKLIYKDHLQTIPDDDPQNALRLGTAIHECMDLGIQYGLENYFMSYPVIDDRHITEAMKIEYWIPKIWEALDAKGKTTVHELYWSTDTIAGTADLLIPVDESSTDVWDLYDFKYSNNIDHYMESEQLHVYKHFLEKCYNIKIRKMFFVFIPKVMPKQRKTEDIWMFRSRVRKELEEHQVQIKEVTFDPKKVESFINTCLHIGLADDFPKKESRLCDWCEYKDFCLKGDNTMILPSSTRRQVGQTTKRKIWIYGGAFSGKTTFADQAPNPLNLNTDGNIKFVTMPYIPIKDTYDGRHKVLAWQIFKDAIAELEVGGNDFKTIVVDLLEDTYESCRLYMYDKLNITHESDDSFKAWDKVRIEYLSTIRRMTNLDYENIILISHEDSTKDITKKTGDKITAIKPNINDKIANKIAGMVDIVARVVVDGDTRTLEFKADEVVFGGGRLKVNTTSIPLDWNELCKVYDEANDGAEPVQNAPKTEEKIQHEEMTTEEEKPVVEEFKATTDEAPFEEDKPAEPAPARRTRKPRA